MRVVPIAILMMLAFAAPARAQRMAATANARLVVGEVLVLRADPSPPGAEVRQAGGYAELPGAATLRVSANREWKVEAAPVVGSAAVAGLWWRVRSVPSGALAAVASDYRRASAGPVEVARGGPGGGIEIVIDYRWESGAEPVGEPGSLLTFSVAPN